jgi:hypothetical protein
VRDKLFYFGALDIQKASSTKQTDPNRIEQRVVDALAALGSPNENGPIERTNDARVLLLKTDWSAEREEPLHPPLQLHLVGAEERHVRRRLVGPQRERDEKDSSHAVTGSLISTITSDCSTSSASSSRRKTGRARTTVR